MENLTKLQMESEIEQSKRALAITDYKVIKQIEQSCYTPEQWEEIKTEREVIREKIREYESELALLNPTE